MHKSSLTFLENRTVLTISGNDAKDFLQGLVTNDVEKVSNENTIYSALLTPQGKYLHDFFILKIGKKYYLDCEASRVEDLMRRLRIFKLRTNVIIELANEMCVIAIYGDRAIEALSLNNNLGYSKPCVNGIVYTDPRVKTIGARGIVPKTSMIELSENDELKTMPFEHYDKLRISLGLPDSSRDMKIEKSTLLESGFDELNGVSFNKGCYIGQELTARTKHRGLIKRRLIPIHLTTSQPSEGMAIEQENKTIGEVRSFQGDWAIGMIRLDALERDIDITVNGSPIVLKKPYWTNF